jgi:tetratricopeptide (TPR) repeat protein
MCSRIPLGTLTALALGMCSIALAQTSATRERARPAYLSGIQHMRAEQFAEAAKAFEEAVGIDPEFDVAYYQLGRANMAMKKFGEATAAYSKARDIIRAQAGRRFTNQHEAQRLRRERITELDEMIRGYQAGPQTPQAQESVRRLQEQKRQIQDIIQRGDNLTIEAAIPAYISVALGSAYFRSGRLADAEREYKAAIEADAKAGEAHSNLAVVYLETGRIRDAETEVKLAEKAGFRVNPQLKEDIKNRKIGS